MVEKFLPKTVVLEGGMASYGEKARFYLSLLPKAKRPYRYDADTPTPLDSIVSKIWEGGVDGRLRGLALARGVMLGKIQVGADLLVW